jgi:hypothetical protein
MLYSQTEFIKLEHRSDEVYSTYKPNTCYYIRITFGGFSVPLQHGSLSG